MGIKFDIEKKFDIGIEFDIEKELCDFENEFDIENETHYNSVRNEWPQWASVHITCQQNV